MLCTDNIINDMNTSDLQIRLHECLVACESCANQCLKENAAIKEQCIRTDLDCAEICSLTLRLLSRDSAMASKMIDLCIDICDKCAIECEKHDDDHCQHCAKQCRKCIEVCKSFLNAA